MDTKTPLHYPKCIALTKAEQGLKLAKRKWEKEKQRNLVNEPRLDLGWTLLERGEYEKGLADYLSVFGEQYQERKYNGVATALTELGAV
jgi:hypothetical protein